MAKRCAICSIETDFTADEWCASCNADWNKARMYDRTISTQLKWAAKRARLAERRRQKARRHG